MEPRKQQKVWLEFGEGFERLLQRAAERGLSYRIAPAEGGFVGGPRWRVDVQLGPVTVCSALTSDMKLISLLDMCWGLMPQAERTHRTGLAKIEPEEEPLKRTSLGERLDGFEARMNEMQAKWQEDLSRLEQRVDFLEPNDQP